MFRFAVLVALLIGLACPRPAHGQSAGLSKSDAKVIVLGDGRLAILQSGSGGAIVGGLVDGDRTGPTPVDLKVGDQIVRFQDITAPSADQIATAFDVVPVGGEISLRISRHGIEHAVTFARPATPVGSRIAVATPNGAGAGAWVTGAAENHDFAIAGVHIRENDEGLPEVTHRGSHPSGAAVGLRAGDVISAFNGRAVVALAGLEAWYERVPAGGEIVLTVNRAGQTATVKFVKP